MIKIRDEILCELHILKNRLDAGESILQCLSTMGIPLEGNRDFLAKWEKLSRLILEGHVLPAKAVGLFATTLEDSKRLNQLARQKTLSPRIQAFATTGVVLTLLLSSIFLFPPVLQPGPWILSSAIGLSLLSIYIMHRVMSGFLRKLDFLEWIFFLRSVALSLECGMTLAASVAENIPGSKIETWPRGLRARVTLDFLEQGDLRPSPHPNSKLWTLADRLWITVCKNYREGLPQVEMIAKLSRLQEEEFKNWITTASEKLGYYLLIPLFALSVPAALLLLFGPLLSALGS